MNQKDVVFVESIRTAFGRMGGSIRNFSCSELGTIALKGLLNKTKISEKTRVDAVFAGSATHCSESWNPARWISLAAGMPYETSASFIEMQCGSAIDAINHAAWKIKLGYADVMIAGGMESYSQMPVKFSMSTPPYKMQPPKPLECTLAPVSEDNIGMGITAENLQEKYRISREGADEFAFISQMRAKQAIESNHLAGEITPVTIPATRKTPEVSFIVDEHPRPQTTLEALAKLKPVFKKDGTITAGNASGQNDGAAFVLMMNAEKAKALGFSPLARWIADAIPS